VTGLDATAALLDNRPRARARRVSGRRGLGGPAALRPGFVRRDHGVQLGSVRRRPGCRGQEPEPAGPAGRAHQPAGLGAAGPMRERRGVFAELGPLLPPRSDEAPGAIAWSEDGQLEHLAALAGLTPRRRHRCAEPADLPRPGHRGADPAQLRPRSRGHPALRSSATRGALTRAFAGSRKPDGTYRRRTCSVTWSPGPDAAVFLSGGSRLKRRCAMVDSRGRTPISTLAGQAWAVVCYRSAAVRGGTVMAHPDESLANLSSFLEHSAPAIPAIPRSGWTTFVLSYAELARGRRAD